MSFARELSRQRGPARVCVVHPLRGRWEVVPLKGRSGIACATLEDARQIAYRSVGQDGDCELVVRDAYNRVLERSRFPDRGAPRA